MDRDCQVGFYGVGRGIGVGRGRGVGIGLGVTDGVPVALGVGVAVEIGVGVGVPHGSSSWTSSTNIPVRSPKSSSWTRNSMRTVWPAYGVMSTV